LQGPETMSICGSNHETMFTYNLRTGIVNMANNLTSVSTRRERFEGAMRVDGMRVADGYAHIFKKELLRHKVGCWCHSTVTACVWTGVCIPLCR
jgi:hypothetical protein